jgi:haloalkane dehalogenase
MGKNVTKADLKAYADPFPTPDSRLGPAIFPVQIVGATPWLVEIEKRLGNLAGKPVEFVFGLKDLGTRPADMAMWLKHYPDAGVQKFPGANHFTQEDCPEAYVTAVQRILAKA